MSILPAGVDGPVPFAKPTGSVACWATPPTSSQVPGGRWAFQELWEAIRPDGAAHVASATIQVGTVTLQTALPVQTTNFPPPAPPGPPPRHLVLPIQIKGSAASSSGLSIPPMPKRSVPTPPPLSPRPDVNAVDPDIWEDALLIIPVPSSVCYTQCLVCVCSASTPRTSGSKHPRPART